MNEFTKSVLLMFFTALLGAAISSFSTVSSVTTEMRTIVKSIDKIDIKLDKFDERLRQAEIYQAQFKQEYLAAN